jgi:hypothetical protein
MLEVVSEVPELLLGQHLRHLPDSVILPRNFQSFKQHRHGPLKDKRAVFVGDDLAHVPELADEVISIVWWWSDAGTLGSDESVYILFLLVILSFR